MPVQRKFYIWRGLDFEKPETVVGLAQTLTNMEQILDENELIGGEVRYAGFWIRVGAAFIDTIILYIPWVMLFFILGWEGLQELTKGVTYNIVSIVYALSYYVFLESGPWQGTVGKKVLGLKIVDAETMGRITPQKALGRYFAKFLATIILFIGIIMVAFQAKKQGLHDKMAGTYVLE